MTINYSVLFDAIERGALEHPADPNIDQEATELRVQRLTKKVREQSKAGKLVSLLRRLG
jgi:hypothetical protein